MIDSHCHLNFPAIKADIKNVIKRSKASGVTKLLTINTNPDEFDDHYSLIKEYEHLIDDCNRSDIDVIGILMPLSKIAGL